MITQLLERIGLSSDLEGPATFFDQGTSTLAVS
jgi:hypothetical protein